VVTGEPFGAQARAAAWAAAWLPDGLQSEKTALGSPVPASWAKQPRSQHSDPHCTWVPGQHLPAVQVPVAQTWPQAPQFTGSVPRLTQAVAQGSGRAGGQRQDPPWQSSPARVQAVVHEPQWARSVWRSVHRFWAAHRSGAAGGQAQVPARQASPVRVQAVAHDPQWARSVWRFVHRFWAAHRSGFAAGQAQEPAWHASPARVQAVPQEPQLRRSLPVSTHCGLARAPQSVAGGVQAQAPAAQDPSPQSWPQAPQFRASPWRLTQAPPQIAGAEGGQAQAPAVQTAPGLHGLPHCPQLAGSVRRSRQVPTQRVWPTGHGEEEEPQAERARAAASAARQASRRGSGMGVSRGLLPQCSGGPAGGRAPLPGVAIPGHGCAVPLVSLDRVDVRLWGRRILEEVSLEIGDGESWAVVGGNGAGKSTLLRLLRGDEQPTPESWPRRRYHLDGPPHPSPIGSRPRIALVSPEQQEAYRRRDWDLPAASAIRSGLSDGVWPDGPATPAEELLVAGAAGRAGASHLLGRSLLSLSTGELRRVLLARALVTAPRLLLLDEPCDGLDAEARDGLLALLDGLARSGLALVLATHRPEEIVPGIARVAVMEGGRIVARGGREEMLARAGSAAASGTTVGAAAPAAAASTAGTDRPLLRVERADVLLEGRPALHDLSWTVRRGEHWVVSGPNGAGKSTLLRLAVGDEHAMPGGTVRRLGLGPRASVWEVKARVGVVSPDLQARFRADIPAEEVVLSGLTSSVGLDFTPSPAERSRAAAAMARAGAGHLAGRGIHALSYGEMRRLLVARALVREPELLVLDEPMNGLDPGARASLAAWLDALAAAGVTLVVATHHRAEIPAAVTHELELRGGRVAYQGRRR